MADLGRYNRLKVLYSTPHGIYLDGGNHGEILLPTRYIPRGTALDDLIPVFVYRDSEDRVIATTEEPLVVAGEFASLEVVGVHRQMGVFLNWGSPLRISSTNKTSPRGALCRFDAAKRKRPEARAEMVAKMGLKKIAYDWRQEHVAEFEREILAYQKHGIEMFAFWGMHDEAFRLFEKYKLHPQLWIMMKGTGDTQEAQVKSAAEGLLPILAKAKTIGSQVGIYNHGGWGGEPENMVAVCDYLKKNHATDNIGIIYNLHHGHSHLDRLPKAIEAMKPHLLCLNLNGMDIARRYEGPQNPPARRRHAGCEGAAPDPRQRLQRPDWHPESHQRRRRRPPARQPRRFEMARAAAR
jgi:hypothetical protein